MNIVPLVCLKNARLYDGKEGNEVSLDNVLRQVEKDSMLYVLDLDGIERDNPNLEMYQRLAEHCVLWIDNGPRRIDDVMDTIMSGATNLTLREELWPAMDMSGVQELTDDEIYLDKTRQYQEQKSLHIGYSGDVGIIVFDETVAYGGLPKEPMGIQKRYLYTNSLENVSLWTEQGLGGIIIDLKKKTGAV
ncbi:MAG: hypothetical protein H6P94_654 [Thermoplasmatales archaeon]|jgi:hypothetical protein|nr:hypothetical protein [Thermoplasmatales archaeon]